MSRVATPIVAAALAGLALIGFLGFIVFTGEPAGDGEATVDGSSAPAGSERGGDGETDGAGAPSSAGLDAQPASVQDLAVSTVRLLGLDGDGVVACAESGVVVTNDGAILTTSRFSGSDPSCPYLSVGVARTYDADNPTELMYEAEVVATEGNFTVLRPSGVLGAAPWPPLPWEPAPLGFGVVPEAGEAIRVLGYTEILDREARVRVSETRLTVTGQTDASYLIDGTLAPGSEGGVAVDGAGRVIGLVDIDGAATGILPIDAVRPILEAADAAEPLVATLESFTASVDIDFGAIVLSSPRFTEQDDLESETVDAIQSGAFEAIKVAQAGKEVLCLAFAWAGIPVGASWDALWYRNGVLQEAQASTDMTWSNEAGEDRFFWQCAQDPDGLKPGTWEFGFRVGGRTMFVEAIEMVGNPPESVPLVWVNNTGVELCEFAINPVAPLEYVGLNLFSANNTMPAGQTLSYGLPPGRYVVEAKDCDGEVVVGVYEGLKVESGMEERLELKAG